MAQLDANVGALTGTGTVNHSGSGSNTLSVASGDFGGTIESSGGMLALLKTGSGQLILSGTDTYSGGTTVNAGTLCVTDAGAIANGTNLTIGPGGTFIYNPAGSRRAERNCRWRGDFFIFRPRCLQCGLAADFEWGARAEHAALIACRRRRRTALARPAAEALGPIVSET